MAGQIQVLPEKIAQRIAAGEVIERPSSVVKELIENAIDAKASEIVVELRAGGFHLIRVQDNGEGMEAEEVPLALERHATSKIRQLEDLYAIQTLGFRGEALPSIASVSEMTIKTRVAHSIRGTSIHSEGGQIKSISEIGCPVGTEVEVQNLFFNLPVKRKFLKSIPLELRHALSSFFRLSLSHPEISFKFIHDGRILHDHPRTESLLVRSEAILGREVYHELGPIEYEEKDIRLSGYATPSTFLRGNSDGIYLYINQRFVRDRIVYKAIMEAYRHRIPTGKFPVVLLFMTLSPSAIDVNVHPTKTEVKFRESERIFPAVFAAFRAFHEQSLPLGGTESSVLGEGTFATTTEAGALPPEPYAGTPLSASGEPGGPSSMIKEESPLPWRVKQSVSLRVIDQVQGTYILCESQKGLVFIDQHAAHERVVFEKLKKEYEMNALPIVRFLLPILIELTAEESFVLANHLDAFQKIGFEIDPAGDKCFALRSIPSLVEKEDPRGMVQSLLEEAALPTGERRGSEIIDRMLRTLACHNAVKGSFSLRKEELEAFVETLQALPLSTTCPHGRPIFFLLDWEELGKRFRRNRSGVQESGP